MTTLKVWLIVALAAQLLLSLSVFISSGSQGSAPVSQPLLELASDEISRIAISDGQSSVTLRRSDDGWRLDESGLPANEPRINTLLSSLRELRTGWPVATTTGGRERFEVAEDKYQRHLRLYKGENPAGEFYFGTSPGFRQTHGRIAGQDEVYALDINNFDMPAAADDWLDKTLLAVPDIDSISGPDYVLRKEEDAWTLADLDAESEQADPEAIDKLASALERLRVTGLAEQPEADEQEAEEADTAGDEATREEPETRTLSVDQGDKRLTYTFRKEGERHTVSRDDIDHVFGLSSTEYSKIVGLTREDLLLDQAAVEGGSGQENTGELPQTLN